MADAGVGTHGEAVLRLVGLLDLLGVERDVERFEGVQVDCWELGGDGCGEHALADFWGEVVEGCVVGAVNHFVGAEGLLVNVMYVVCWNYTYKGVPSSTRSADPAIIIVARCWPGAAMRCSKSSTDS